MAPWRFLYKGCDMVGRSIYDRAHLVVLRF
jgi:hypothetical protein